MSSLSIFQSSGDKCSVHVVCNTGLQRTEKNYSITKKLKLISIPFEICETLMYVQDLTFIPLNCWFDFSKYHLWSRMKIEQQDKNHDSAAYSKGLHKLKWCWIIRQQCYSCDLVLDPEDREISEKSQWDVEILKTPVITKMYTPRVELKMCGFSF